MKIIQIIKKFNQQKQTKIVEIPDDLKEGDKLIVTEVKGCPDFGGFLGIACTGWIDYFKFEKEVE